MSDGERAIFYYIGEVLSAKKNSLIIIDEPENHLHKSILVRLWNSIETARDDCVFLYVTHNLDFACSRVDSQIVWVKNMLYDKSWDYELIDDNTVPDGLMLEILGNRQNVLLVEGSTNKSIDRKLYSKIYSSYNIIPLESCQAVISATKTYKNTTTLHHSNVYGIIDLDRRSDEEISKLKDNNIYTLQVAEIENLFLLPEVIRCVANKLNSDNFDEILESTQNKVMEFLQNHIDEQALLFTKQMCNNFCIQQINLRSKNVEEYESCLSNLTSILNVRKTFEENKLMIQKIIEDNDYLSALKVINDKGLLPFSNLPNAFGWKKDKYIDQVIIFTGQNNTIGEKLRNTFRSYISLPLYSNQ